MYTSATNFGVIKPCRMGWTGCVAPLVRTERLTEFWRGIWKERDRLEDLRVDGKVTCNVPYMPSVRRI
jgi:hypothetical protein